MGGALRRPLGLSGIRKSRPSPPTSLPASGERGAAASRLHFPLPSPRKRPQAGRGVGYSCRFVRYGGCGSKVWRRGNTSGLGVRSRACCKMERLHPNRSCHLSFFSVLIILQSGVATQTQVATTRDVYKVTAVVSHRQLHGEPECCGPALLPPLDPSPHSFLSPKNLAQKGEGLGVRGSATWCCASRILI
jgi:hypothetical protein